MRRSGCEGTLTAMQEAQGIYRGEVYAIMGALADIDVTVRRIRSILEGADDEEEEEDDA